MPRKPNAEIHKPSAFLPIEIDTISHSPEFVRGAKKEIRDDNGKLLYSARQMRMHIGGTFTKEQAETIASAMKEQGIKNIKFEKTKLNLPSECPSCHHQGSPSIYKGKGTLRIDDERNQINRDEFRLIWSHTKTKPKTCFVGNVNLDTPITQIKLKKGLPIDALGHRRRVGIYPL